ncbi:hypothetical protein AB0L65_48120 [Nonomuraea sp. NPDC052116]|uniref:hypothetical protein n=1 Tax=Nonomuraea sp. NPDC052116 TaxID=3155665 RepID=UPI00342AE596
MNPRSNNARSSPSLDTPIALGPSEGGHRWVTLTDPEGNEFDLFEDTLATP